MHSPFSSVGSVAARPPRLRRSTLAVPGSNPRMIAKGAGSDADEVLLDLEDAVAPSEKARARSQVAEALLGTDFGGKTVVVRVNAVSTPHAYKDLVEVVKAAGAAVDAVMVPKVQDPGQVWFVEHLLTQLEAELGLGARIGLEVQIEDGRGSTTMVEISRVTDRLESLVFGPGDYAADMGVGQLDIGAADADYPGHQWHYVLAKMVSTARAVGADAIDGPYSDFRDLDGFAASCRVARMLGIDGKWCIHPSQIPVANSAFTPAIEEFERAQALLAAYSDAVAEGRGATTADGKMIDEASRKMAEKLVARGEAAGLRG